MNLNVIIDVLTGCTLIILYACHDNYDSVFALPYSWFFEVLKFRECLIFRFFAILFSQMVPLYGLHGLISMIGMHAAI